MVASKGGSGQKLRCRVHVARSYAQLATIAKAGGKTPGLAPVRSGKVDEIQIGDIEQARPSPSAKQGDIFTPGCTPEFLKVIRGALLGSKAVNVRKTIRQGEPVIGVHLAVNGAYPGHLPRTTVPPTLLLRLPRLPDKLAYRIVDHDFVLQDTEARIVVDFIPGALP